MNIALDQLEYRRIAEQMLKIKTDSAKKGDNFNKKQHPNVFKHFIKLKTKLCAKFIFTFSKINIEVIM